MFAVPNTRSNSRTIPDLMYFVPASRGFVPHTSVFGTDVGSSPTGSSANKRRLPNEDDVAEQEENPAIVAPSDSRPSLYSVAQAGGTAAVKRGPGRPRKVPVGGNGAPGPLTTQDGQSPAKRPRGRPKGSKNKPKVEPPSAPAAEA
jgi:hypothetical protein